MPDFVVADNVPDALRSRDQWLVHKGKIPHYANGSKRRGQQGSVADRKALTSFDAALRAALSMGMDGIGFAMLPGDGLVGIDIDHAIDRESGAIDVRASAITKALGSYTELSPSGTGFHVWCLGETESFKSNAIGLEVFCGSQFFTVTGKWWPESPRELMPIGEAALRRLKKTVDLAKAGGRSKAAASREPASDARAKIESALLWISPDIGYEAWIQVGMAIHSALGEAGLTVWDYWSGKSGKYPGANVLEGHWRSFKAGGGVTDATLFKMARDAGWRATGARAVERAKTEERPATSESWPTLALPGAMRTPAITADVLPGIAGQMAGAVARSTQTPETASVMVLLAILATVFQRRFEVSPYGDDYRESLSLWTLTALPSGARKSAILNALAAPLHRHEKLERDRLRLEIARNASARRVSTDRIRHLTQEAAKTNDGEKRGLLVKEMEEVHLAMPSEIFAPRLSTSDVTPEQLQRMIERYGERMALLSDEAGIFGILAGQYSGGTANIDAFLQGYSGMPFRVDRAERNSYVSRPALTFGLMVQPASLADLAGNKRFRDSGLLARFLPVVPESTVGSRDVRARSGIAQEIGDKWEELILDVLPRGPLTTPDSVTVLQLSDEAREFWFKFADFIERNQGDGGRFESIADWTSKLPGNVARIGALLELSASGGEATTVTADTMQRAVRIGEQLIPHAQAMFRLLGTDPVEDDARALLRWIQANQLPNFKRADAQKDLEGRFRTVKRLKEAAARLAEWNVLSRERLQPNQRARPTPYYDVNPGLFVDSSYSP